MAVNSRKKGKRIELEAVAALKAMGFPNTRRGQQFNGADGSPDVICDDLPELHLECKGDQSIDLGTKALDEACYQAATDASQRGRRWVLLWKPMRRSWRATWHDQTTGQYVTTADGIDVVLRSLNGPITTPGLNGDAAAHAAGRLFAREPPGEGEFKFRIAVQCVGRKPTRSGG
jgi:hypothetical protein